LTFTINGTVQDIAVGDDGLETVTLLAKVDDTWNVSYKNDFNELSEYPVKGILSNNEGRIVEASIVLKIEGVDNTQINLEVGSHVAFTGWFDRKPVEVATSVVADEASIVETVASTEETSTSETTSEETASTEEVVLTPDQTAQLEEIASTPDQTEAINADTISTEETISDSAGQTANAEVTQEVETASTEETAPDLTGQVADTGDVVQTNDGTSDAPASTEETPAE
jgi:hypothetical protein